MWGWKAVEREIQTARPINSARALLKEAGFVEEMDSETYFLFRRPGNDFAFRGEKAPLELTLMKNDQGLFFQLRYDVFVLFDTGDLKKIADTLEELLR